MIEYLGKLVRRQDLTEAEASAAMEVIMRDEATPSQIAGFVVALRVKGETIEEITGLLRTLRAFAVPIQVEGDLLDVVGTGGDAREALGVRIDLAPDGVARCVAEAGIGFLFAPLFHPSFRFASVPRRELGVRTIFNILGPLCNPAHATFQAVGVAEAGLVAAS